ncbi:2-phosphosulfolactate phosphatase family protein [Thermoanaerobacterium sp. R66]|uniref:2-phosphosulfolactate phosphatase family protein n=1 Tax=Thermoanaerobacterium sp. R66 TaxID=2742479 RepID=UPI0023807256|nr:2-phosphosulfolactate phosphatase family protein [Thermoanaerobacterium sp. R66]MDE4542408.1 2-phosphosulfolactate phosphatase family protein [Thermoanaerobacterium sp. R66]
MYVETYETYSIVPEEKLENKVVVVIDTLRMSSVITTALANGAKEVIPVAEIEDAVRLAKYLGRNNILLGGERNGAKIEGFDLANSPFEYKVDIVKNKTIIITTTNGTKALKKASISDDVIIGCLLNVSAVADYLSNKNKDVVIICAGTKEKFSIDDIITAGAIYDKLKNKISFDSDDLSKASYFLYQMFQNDIPSILKESIPFSIMKRLGYEEDLPYCSSVDMFYILPKYSNDRGSIIR